MAFDLRAGDAYSYTPPTTTPQPTVKTPVSSPNQTFNFMNESVSYNPNTGVSKSLTPPNPSTPVSTDLISNGTSLNFASGGVPENGSSAVALATGTDMATTGDYSQDPNVKTEQSKVDKTIADLLATELPSQETLLSEAREKEGANAKLAEVNNLKTQLAASVAAYNNDFAQTETRGIQAGVPALFYQGEIAAKQRQASIITTGIAARLQAAQGNYELAEQLAEKTAELKFNDAQAKINRIKDFIDLNKESLTKAETLAMSKMAAQVAKDQKALDEKKAAVSFALANGINKPFYQIGGTIYRSSDGKAYSTPAQFFADGGAEDYSNTQVVSQAVNEEKDAVIRLADKYFDAGITLADSLGTAQQKAKKSSIFRKETYIAPSSSGGGGGGGPLGLSNQQIDNVAPLVSKFQDSDTVKNYNVIGETLNAVRSAGITPTDDIQRIYAFAKIMDPGSVVREGEYKTVQDYATSLLQRTGIKANRVFNNDGFLTDEARKFLLNTLENRFKASETSYKNLYDETARRINLVGSTDKGSQLLNNYGGAFEVSSGQFTIPFEQLNEAKQEGYKIIGHLPNGDVIISK